MRNEKKNKGKTIKDQKKKEKTEKGISVKAKVAVLPNIFLTREDMIKSRSVTAKVDLIKVEALPN